ncbi:hypothetical protein DSUL_160016 [Desulfovibrionales bacterium]
MNNLVFFAAELTCCCNDMPDDLSPQDQILDYVYERLMDNEKNLVNQKKY